MDTIDKIEANRHFGPFGLPHGANLTSLWDGKSRPAVSVVRDVLRRLETELHLCLGGLPSGEGPLSDPLSPDERPPLVIRRRTS